MPRLWMVLTAALVATPAVVAAGFVFDWRWTSVGEFAPANDATRARSGALRGEGTLTVTPQAGGGYRFEFSGTGGSGAGRTGPDGSLGEGGIAFPTPPGVFPGDSAPPPRPDLVGGALRLLGDPADPTRVELRYVEGDRCNTFCDAWFRSLEGAGTRRRSVSAAEPGVLALAAWLLAAAVALGRRRRPGR